MSVFPFLEQLMGAFRAPAKIGPRTTIYQVEDIRVSVKWPVAA